MNITLQNHDQIITPSLVTQMNDTLKSSYEFFQESKDVYGLDKDIDETINLYLQEIGHWYDENVGKVADQKKSKPDSPKDGERGIRMNDIPFLVKKFVPQIQIKAIIGSQEHFGIVDRLRQEIKAIPNLREQDGEGLEAKAYVHFFNRTSDWYITKWDGKDSLFGYAVLHGDLQNSEFGYMSLAEFQNPKTRTEMDFFWKVKTVSEALNQSFPGSYPKQEKKSKRAGFTPKSRGKKKLAYKHKSRGKNTIPFRKGQKVEVTVGKDKGKVGKVVARIHPQEDTATVQFVECEVEDIKLTNLKATTKELTQNGNSKPGDKKPTTRKTTSTRSKSRSTTAKKTSTTRKKKSTTTKKRTTTRKNPSTTAKKKSRRGTATGTRRKSTSRRTAKKATGRAVSATSAEQRVAKRALNMHDKVLTWTQILNFIKYIQRFATKKEITKKSKHASVIKEIGDMAINFYSGMERKDVDKEKFSIPETLRTKLEKIAGSEHVRPSVRLINSFVSMLGKTDFDKMARLVNRIESALEKNRVGKNDPYYDQLQTALKKLRTAIEKKDEIDIPQTALSGINSVLEYFGIKPKPAPKANTKTIDVDYEDVSDGSKKKSPSNPTSGLSGIDQIRLKAAMPQDEPSTQPSNPDAIVNFKSFEEPTPRSGVEDEFFVSADKLGQRNSSRKKFRLNGAIGELLGDLERYELAITIEGDEGSKKTRFSYQLADAFIDKGFSVGMFSLEIGEQSSLINDMVNQYLAQRNRSKLKVAGRANGIDTIRKYANDFDVIIIDSWGKLDEHSSEFDKLRKEFPGTIFCVIFQRTTNGIIRGGTAPLYDAGINLKAVKELNPADNYVYASKNRYGYTDQKYVIDRKAIEGSIYQEEPVREN